MTDKTFSKTEMQIGEWWKKTLDEEMKSVAEEEKQLAIEKGQIDIDGTPWIRVIADGGWSKRSHKHSYNALGGAAVIIGANTKKLLYLGVQMKYCKVCNQAENKGETKEHKCFMNWEDSSRSMESDMILEAFNEAEGKYNLHYMELVGDGDYSVLATLQANGPPWCRRVKKIECPNHCCKCCRGALEKLVDDHPEFKGRDKLT